MKTETKKICAAFESWQNGGIQMSALYLGEDAEKFEESHYASVTFATLHTFDSVAEGRAAYKAMQEKN